MVRTKNAGVRNEGETSSRNRGKAPANRAESSTLTANAQQRIAEALARNKIFIAERGIPRIQEGCSNFWFFAEVAGRGWSTFCEPRDPAVIPVVREFYARVPDHQGGKVRVRGKTVKFDAVTLNHFFELPIPEVDEYAAFVESGFTAEKAEQVRQVLTDGAGQWAMRNGEFVSLQRNTLDRFAKTWFYFVVFSMLPVTHHNLCRREPAILLYAILTHLKINVGQLIFRGILQSAEPTKGYWFPSLVTMLCRQAGVAIEEHEETLPPGTIMTQKYIEKLCNSGPQDMQASQRRNRARARAIRAGPSAPADHSTQDPPPENQDIPDASGNPVLQLLRQMQRENRATRQEFRFRHEHIDANLRRNEENLRYQWMAAGYDMSQFQNMIPWEESSQAAQWDEYVDNEESEEESANQDSSEEE